MRNATSLHLCYVRTFEGEAGQTVLEDIEARAYLRETSFTPDPQRSAFNEGRRSLALHIRRMLETDGQPRQQATAVGEAK